MLGRNSVRFCLIALSAVISTIPSFAAEDPLARFLHDNAFVVVPLGLQNSLRPGAILIVERNGHKVLSTQTYQPNRLINGERGAAVAGAVSLNTYFSAGGSINLGALNPGATFTRNTGWSVGQVEFATNEITDQGLLDTYVETDPTANAAMNRYRVKSGGVYGAFDTNYKIYLVTSIFSTTKINVKSSSNVGLQLRNNAAAADCAKPQAPAAAAAAPAADPASTLYSSSIKVCHNADGSYDLSHEPPVPLGLKVEEVNISSENKPEAKGMDWRHVQLQ